LSIADAKFHSNTGLLAYVRSFDFAGQSAKFDVIVPASSFAAHGFVNDQPREREMSGPGDPRFRVSVNLFGAPALSAEGLRELPAGPYRWSEPSGFSATWAVRQQQAAQPRQQSLVVQARAGDLQGLGSLDIRSRPSVTFFSDNTDFFGANTFAQAPIYALQAHILYTFQSGMWIALDGIYFAGGHTSLNGVESDNEQRNTRAGFTLALPIDRHNSLKLSASTGISTRTGSEFSAVGIAWQYRWGDGY
jgi:hypothetical protein